MGHGAAPGPERWKTPISWGQGAAGQAWLGGFSHPPHRVMQGDPHHAETSRGLLQGLVETSSGRLLLPRCGSSTGGSGGMLIWSRKGEGTGKLHLPSHPEIPSGHPRVPRPSSLCPQASSRGQAAGAKASVGMTSFLTGRQRRGGTVPRREEPATPATRRDAARDHQRWPSRSPARRCPAVPPSPVPQRVPTRPGTAAIATGDHWGTGPATPRRV